MSDKNTRIINAFLTSGAVSETQKAAVRALVLAKFTEESVVSFILDALKVSKAKAESEAQRALKSTYAKAGGFVGEIPAALIVGKVETGPNAGRTRTSMNLYDGDNRGLYQDPETGDWFGISIHNVSEMRRRIAERKAAPGSTVADDVLAMLEEGGIVAEGDETTDAQQ